MIFDEIYETENLEEAWKRVRAAKSPAGIDRISVPDFEKNISANLHMLQKQIREEQYKPKMFKGCAVLSHLVQKARDTNYLTHYERVVLLYTLTFAGQEGTDFLHKVIGYCINYNQHTTRRFVERRKDSPISCAKIGEYFPELIKEKGCLCKFNL